METDLAAVRPYRPFRTLRMNFIQCSTLVGTAARTLSQRM